MSQGFFFPAFPLQVQVEPTNLCNLNCLMCPRQKMTYPVGYMKLDLFKKIVDECATNGPLLLQGENTKASYRIVLKLFFLGEPLLHPQLKEMLAYASGKVIITITTNGTLLKGDILRSLLTYANGINISMDGFYEDYNELRKGAKFNDVADNVKHLCDLKKEMGLSTKMAIVTIMPDEDVEASNYLTELLVFWRNYDILVNPLERQKHEGTFWLGNEPSGAEPVNRITPCQDGLKSLVVRWDGEATYCCNDINTEAALGNVKETTLSDIWLSDKLNAIRQKIMALDYNSLPICRTCTVNYQIKRNLLLPLMFKDKITPAS